MNTLSHLRTLVSRRSGRRGRTCAKLLLLGLLGTGAAHAQVPQLNVVGVDANGTTSVSGYRWLIEEDVTWEVQAGTTCQPGFEVNCPSANFHKSYLPAIAEGSAGDPLPNLDGNRRYYVSILPDGGYGMGGSKISAGQGNVTIHVNSEPLPPAQIRIFVFDDSAPINGAPDTPAEDGLGGYNILLEDAGGRYGNSAQQISTDAFGNPLGTTYNAAGDVQSLGDGTVTTNANGVALIKNLVPGKYGIQVTPPNSNWVQTTTLEGKKVIDAWVGANEPPYFTEFGPPGPHVFIGFVEQFTDPDALSGGVEITGNITSIHNSRPPNFTFYSGADVPGCWVGLNDLRGGGKGVGAHAAPCDPDSGFSIPNVPDGRYQLALWDANLDYIFGAVILTIVTENGVTTCNGGSCSLGDVPIFAWFGRIEQHVFSDDNENGFWDPTEQPLFEVGTGLRWRDGTIYQEFPTDLGGAAPYDEVFPFFSWLVAEVGFSRFKATGATVIVDGGGAIPPGEDFPSFGVLTPQVQTDGTGTGFCGSDCRIELGPVLTQGVQTFLGQTNIIQWGKTPYEGVENGGISGIVFSSVTRAEDDPAYAAAELWEPGIPRLQVALYADNLPAGGDGVIDDVNGDGCPTVADVDNYPYRDATAFPGPEDLDYPALNSNCVAETLIGNGVFDYGDAIQLTTTDSWDDSVPEGCQGPVFSLNETYPLDCFDGLRNFNQVRPAVFDGGYAFTTYVPGGVETGAPELVLPAGTYIVGTGEHPAYTILREEDRNIDFGDEFNPAPDLLPPPCVGDDHLVPLEFSLFPLFEEDGTPAQPYRAGTNTPLCDRKKVRLSNGQNAAADFFLFTFVPAASKITGFILDDTSNEFDATSPTFGEKYAPPYVPVSIRDWTGREIGRTYSDRWGTFNAVVPSTFTTNVASSSGMSPNMVTTCMNDPGPVSDGAGGFITDPFYDSHYSQFCYTFQYMPGVTTYLDTPVVPVAAFAGPNQQALECRDDSGTPVIFSVLGSMSGPYVSTTVGNGVDRPYSADGTQRITITAAVAADGRDFGFGSAEGAVTIGETPLTDVAWSNGAISATVPVGTRTGQLTVTRDDNGLSNIAGITVTIGGPVVQVAPGGSIQLAIDVAAPGDLVLVPPGEFEELVIMHKPVRLQGSGAGTTISAIKTPAQKLNTWRESVRDLEADGAYDLLPAQQVTNPILGEAAFLATEEGPAIIVLGKSDIDNWFGAYPARIDGFTLTGADHAGGVIVNGYAEGLEISNNRIFSNNGIYSGGVRIGHPELALEQGDDLIYQDGENDFIRIHHNVIAENGGLGGAGGGVSLYHGSDDYAVTDNFICGNFSQGDGAGIGHYGLSDNGLIERNTIVFNQSFTQLGRPGGGGISIGGAPNLLGGIGQGAGSVSIRANRIQGNNAAVGDGAGIRASAVNGILQTNPADWYKLEIVNNMIVNNMAGMAGGGIALGDTAVAEIVNNTIAHNDSTGTAGDAFNDPNVSTPQPAGIVSFAHSDALDDELGTVGGFSQPTLLNNIVWRNRSFFYDAGLQSATPLYQDLAVLGVPGTLEPEYNLLTDASGYSTTNQDGGGVLPLELFGFPYVNTDNGQTVTQIENTTTIATQPAFDEGGNFIQVRFGPLELIGDYSLPTSAVLAIDQGTANGAPTTDIDGEPRPTGNGVDIGADERPGDTPQPPSVPAMTDPLENTVLAGVNVDFAWEANGATVDEWWVYAGASARKATYFNSGNLGTATTVNVTGLPVDGSTVYLTLWYRVTGGAWESVVSTYTADTDANVADPAFTSPASPSTLAGTSVPFTWADNGTTVNEWWVYAGAAPRQATYYNSRSLGSSTSTTVSRLPTDGSTVYLTLWYRASGGPWRSVVETYTASEPAAKGSVSAVIEPLGKADLK